MFKITKWLRISGKTNHKNTLFFEFMFEIVRYELHCAVVLGTKKTELPALFYALAQKFHVVLHYRDPVLHTMYQQKAKHYEITDWLVQKNLFL